MDIEMVFKEDSVLTLKDLRNVTRTIEAAFTNDHPTVKISFTNNHTTGYVHVTAYSDEKDCSES